MLPSPLLLHRDIRSNPMVFSRPGETNELAAIAAVEESQEGMQIGKTAARDGLVGYRKDILMDIRIPSAGGLPHVLLPFVVAFQPRHVINALEKKLSTLPTYLHHACCRRILVFLARNTYMSARNLRKHRETSEM